MSPALTDFKGLTEQMGSAVFVGAAQEDHSAFELSVQVEAEVRRHGATLINRERAMGESQRTERNAPPRVGRIGR